MDLTQIAEILKHTYKLKVFCLINFYVVQILVLHFDKLITDFIHRLCLTTVKAKRPNLVTTVSMRPIALNLSSVVHKLYIKALIKALIKVH